MLVTGATGSFGNAFVRRCLEDGAARVVIYSRDEAKQAAMRAALGDPATCRWMIGDVRDYDRLCDAMRGVEVCVHAAAMKRIETCEDNPHEAAKTNIGGTVNVARACIEAGVERAVLLSTDKSAAPVTLYGATKLAAERLWLASSVYAAGTLTRFAATRYGNVCSSTGSVIPLWKAQRDRGEPLTITDESASRFWMTLDDAVSLVLLALREMRGGDLYLPRLGAAPILSLARAIVETNGTYAPGHVVTGLRAGEKLHELLISEDEAPRTYDAGTHYVIEPAERTWGEVAPLPWPLVPRGFSLSSLNNPRQLSVEELRRMVA